MRDPKGYNANGPLTWENGFLPALFGGTEFNSAGRAGVQFEARGGRVRRDARKKLDLLAKLNEEYRRGASAGSRFGNAHPQLRNRRAHADFRPRA